MENTEVTGYAKFTLKSKQVINSHGQIIDRLDCQNYAHKNNSLSPFISDKILKHIDRYKCTDYCFCRADLICHLRTQSGQTINAVLIEEDCNTKYYRFITTDSDDGFLLFITTADDSNVEFELIVFDKCRDSIVELYSYYYNNCFNKQIQELQKQAELKF